MLACEIAYALPAALVIESLNLRQQCIPGIMGHSGTRHNCQVGILVAPSLDTNFERCAVSD
jgi:hypothetical protein